MASSGSKTIEVTMTKGGTIGDSLQFKWSIVNQDATTNKSTVSWQLILISYDYGLINSSAQNPWSVTIDGQTFSGTANVGIGNNTTKTLASGTVTLNHNSDGTKSFDYSFQQTFNITFNGWIGTATGSGTGTLDTIPRATTPTLSATSLDMGEKLTITLKRASSSFTHTLQHDFHAGEWTTFATNVTTSSSLTPPLTWADRIPWATSGTCRIRCITYNGSAEIGKTIVPFTACVPSTVVPSVTSVSVSEAVDGLTNQFGAFIQGQSKLSVTINASGSYSSLIQKYAARFDGALFSEKTFTTEVISTSGTLDLVTTVTDSRKRQGTKTTAISVLAYTAPKISRFSAFRCDADGNEDAEGTNVTIDLAYEITSLNSKNIKSATVYRKRSDEASYSIIAAFSSYTYSNMFLLSNVFDTDYDYELKLEVTDYFKTVEAYATVSAAFTLVDYYSTGKGLSFGKVAQRDGFDVHLRSEFFEPSHFHELTHELIYVNATGADLDNVVDSGEYYVNATTTANCPSTRNGYLTVRNRNENYCLQVYTTYANERYERIKANGTWRTWIDKTFVIGVVEEGTSGIWRYRKWSNGLCELWGTTEQIVASITNTWGSVYTKGDAVASVAYPFTFAAEPVVIISPHRATNNNFGIYTAGNSSPTKQSPAVSVWRGSSSSTTQVQIDFYVYGQLA